MASATRYYCRNDHGINEFPFELKLVSLSVEQNGIVVSDDLSDMEKVWLDYQPNSHAWPLFSEELKKVVEENLTGNEKLDWILAKVNGKNEQRLFYILRFNEMMGVLDMQKTLFVQGTNRVIRPCFSISKISKYAVFHEPQTYDFWKIIIEIYINGQ